MSSASDIFINSAKLESIFTFSIIEYDHSGDIHREREHQVGGNIIFT